MSFVLQEVAGQRLYTGDCREVLGTLPATSIDVVVTSPPYNLGTAYRSYADRLPRAEYLDWIAGVFAQIAGVLHRDGSFFLNVGSTCADPWIAMDVAGRARERFVLQNHFCWVKSIAVDSWERPGLYDGIPRTYGHFQPINSRRFVNQCWEHLFHFTHEGDVPLDRLALGVPYEDQSNLTRGTRGKHGNVRCRGNSWYVPYRTIQARAEKGQHPAVFPEQLVENCLRLHGLRPELSVLDPFLGSGTTLAVCRRLGLAGSGIELDLHYSAWCAERLGKDG